jgi:hypothetical protein
MIGANVTGVAPAAATINAIKIAVFQPDRMIESVPRIAASPDAV